MVITILKMKSLRHSCSTYKVTRANKSPIKVLQAKPRLVALYIYNAQREYFVLKLLSYHCNDRFAPGRSHVPCFYFQGFPVKFDFYDYRNLVSVPQQSWKIAKNIAVLPLPEFNWKSIGFAVKTYIPPR